MNYCEIQKLLKEKDQTQLLKFYDTLSESEKEELLKQIASIDFSLIDLIDQRGIPVNKGKLEPLGALTVNEINKNTETYKKAGREAIRAGKIGAVLLAGGQGTRLGSDRPKGTVDIGISKTFYIFESLINNLMDVVNECGVWVPLFIMTSDKNNTDTIAFFEEKNYFGYNKDYVKFFIQDMAPSVDYNGKVFLEEKGKVSMSPNGNGGWFQSLAKCGLLEYINEKGIEWLNIFAVDNVLQRITDTSFVGATLLSGRDCGAKVVRKADPREKVGVLCLEDGKPSIVEYYEMTDEIINSRDEEGELLYNFGVILNYLFNVKKLEDIMAKKMPIHVVEKKIPHIDENGNSVKPETPNGLKFETLVLDMIHLMDSCLSYEVIREKEFAPIKNKTGVDSIESARELIKLNGIQI